MSLELDVTPALEAALGGGGEMAEAFLEDSSSLMVVIDNAKVEKVLGGQDLGVGLRLIKDLRTSYAFGNQLRAQALVALASDIAAERDAAPGRLHSFAPIAPGLAPAIVKPPIGVETARKVEMARTAEAAARAVDNRVRQVRVIYLERTQRVRWSIRWASTPATNAPRC